MSEPRAMPVVDVAQAMVDSDVTFYLWQLGEKQGRITKIRFLDHPHAEVHYQGGVVALNPYSEIEVSYG